MYITEVILDGFKSYATRTVVSGFDASFNAITGLNGSGKSNILDAICFVLGITDLKSVRVANLQELVYKQGQAGVTRATVTIVFNNEDASLSPVGYEQFQTITVTRQIQVGGKNKYLINGHQAQQHRVQNLFHSVQLNVNNPHFLIMQGRITKVLNMKPPEILGMIEEAAGTRMYENKKALAEKTIEKKEAKFDQINKILTDEIMPMLEKLRGEKAAYVEWSRCNAERERLERFVVAHEYTGMQKAEAKCREVAAAARGHVDECTRRAEAAEAEVARLGARVDELTAARAAHEGDELRTAEALATKLSKELVKVSTAWDNAKKTAAEEAKAVRAAEKGVAEAEAAIAAAAAAFETRAAAAAEAEARRAAAEEAADAAQRAVRAAQAGMGEDGGEGDATAQDRLAAAEKAAAEAKTAAKQAALRLKDVTAQTKAREKDLKSAEREYAKTTAGLEKLQAQLNALEADIEAVGYAPGREAPLRQRRAAAESAVQALRDSRDELAARLTALDFAYAAPEKGFDRSRVKGLVAKLVHVREPAKHATALEVVAGGRLYHVVVDTAETGKALLERGKLQRRVTIIPINRIKPRVIAAERVRAAQELAGPDGAALALSLIGYPAEVEAAMAHVFGSALVCEDLDTARRLAFHKDVKSRAVTLDGDVFDPAGTLSGGSRPSGAPVLEQLRSLAAATEELAKKEKELKAVTAELDALAAAAEKHAALVAKRDVAAHQLAALKSKAHRSEHFQILESHGQLVAQAAGLKEQAAAAAAALKTAEQQTKDIRHEIANAAAVLKSRVAAAEKAAKAARAKVQTADKAVHAAREAADRSESELAQAKAEREQLLAQVEAAQGSSGKQDEEVAGLAEATAEKKAEYDAAKADLDGRRAALAKCDRDAQKAASERERAARRAQDARLDAKRATQKLQRSEKEAADTQAALEAMEETHAWIAAEKRFFGKEHSDYDFAARDPEAVRGQLAKLTEQREELAKKINRKVMTMIERAETEYRDLMTKKQIIENDKKKIRDVIAELDTKKRAALKETWELVNRDFGSMFSTLLPGTNARLDPPEGKTVLDGLEVKVAFGGQWKESLTELSGGQRSLLALSLILALLLFKPAPMYILDEIDAALDLSHTQNIGRLIKSHFSNSQFVVVSLKEGMFSNANVVFRTKFVDGVSTVTRTGGGGGAAAAASDAGGEAAAAADRRRSKRRR